MAKETFEGDGVRTKTSILFLQKKTNPIDNNVAPTFFAIARNTGYAPNESQIPGNELPDILMEYKEYLRGEMVYRHKNCIAATVDDRLDAEYYVPNIVKEDSDSIIANQTAIKPILEEINNQYNNVVNKIAAISSENKFDIVTLDEILDEVGESTPYSF